jgi:septum formation protein
VPVPEVVLASRSPRRLELLTSLGLRVTVDPADVPEGRASGEGPSEMVERLSLEKAEVVAARHPQALVIAADTTVALGGELLEKPHDQDENAAFLRRLSGRAHVVHTGHCLVHQGRLVQALRRTLVRFRALDEQEIAWYVATGEGLDKAGGYAIQGRGAALVDGIDGCYTTVVGLSVPAVVEAARQLGVPVV